MNWARRRDLCVDHFSPQICLMNLRTGLRAYMQKHKHLCNEKMLEVGFKGPYGK